MGPLVICGYSGPDVLDKVLRVPIKGIIEVSCSVSARSCLSYIPDSHERFL
jgi:hypothetical protein